ncbi:polysaccharide deacetylase family protein [Anoxybacillus rupiensis]|jgi:probable sporulation protein (polysaccharide deacetylase family)|uniref:Polysaccharide deacetylase family protein n=1 Tax=Anoxybacteroides rupiense TaxID=311460 RepID=A0ABD5IQH3_9BACL|nr:MULTISPECIES: polysaccharide deacetylase family protein [Anoxybacillus]MDE8563167.1 polysaccharide deacetylase family protein [Anoxybacillus rupiensis]MED5050527.1 polysaccharide deacetylase family protein [Anoxybacillus rupiensis]QHC03728.1 polysaccharide deacetylase family protein [Anoxybacillus sp. PDR2]
MNSLKAGSTEVAKMRDKLYMEIQTKAKRYEIPPQDAVIDRVWKAIPGYNGLKVNVEASYQNMKKDGTFDKRKLVYEQISPKVHLKDLPPEAIYRGHPEKPMVTFLVNVAWGNEYIPKMLEVLKKYNVQATFFLEGRWVKNYPDMAKMIADAGQEIGNHSYSHPDLKTMSNEAIRRELKKTNEVIEATTGVKCKWFAPPSGSYRDDVVKIAHDLKMGTIMWSVDTIDWQKPSPSVIVERVTSKLHPGAIILMHPTLSTAEALEPLIKAIKQKYEIGNVSMLLDEKRIVQK